VDDADPISRSAQNYTLASRGASTRASLRTEDGTFIARSNGTAQNGEARLGTESAA
jgi:hypothetical protein